LVLAVVDPDVVFSRAVLGAILWAGFVATAQVSKTEVRSVFDPKEIQRENRIGVKK